MSETNTQIYDRCKKTKPIIDFMKNLKALKCCLKCREDAIQYRLNKPDDYKKHIEKFRSKHPNYSTNYYKNNTSTILGRMKQLRYNNPLESKFKTMVYNHKTTDIKYDRYDEENHITYDHLMQLFKKIDGKCAYCKATMLIEFQPKNRGGTGLSLQRVDNAIGHTKTNCILSCLKCNQTRQEKFYDHSQYLNAVLGVAEDVDK